MRAKIDPYEARKQVSDNTQTYDSIRTNKNDGGKSEMSEKEKQVIEKLSESIEKLNPLQKEYFSGLADGMALAQQRQENPAAEKAAVEA